MVSGISGVGGSGNVFGIHNSLGDEPMMTPQVEYYMATQAKNLLENYSNLSGSDQLNTDCLNPMILHMLGNFANWQGGEMPPVYPPAPNAPLFPASVFDTQNIANNTVNSGNVQNWINSLNTYILTPLQTTYGMNPPQLNSSDLSALRQTSVDWIDNWSQSIGVMSNPDQPTLTGAWTILECFLNNTSSCPVSQSPTGQMYMSGLTADEMTTIANAQDPHDPAGTESNCPTTTNSQGMLQLQTNFTPTYDKCIGVGYALSNITP